MNAHVNPTQVISSASDHTALRGEAAKPNTCYSLKGAQTLLPYFVLEPNYRQFHSLFLGDEYHLPTNFSEPCMMRIEGDLAYVRRAEVRRVQGERGVILTLAQPYRKDPELLLYVNPKTELPQGAKLKQSFWTSIETNGRIAAFNRNGNERLLAFTEDGQSADVLYNDGDVVRVARIDGELKLLKLSNEEKAEIRIANGLKRLNQVRENKELDADVKAKRIDAAYHQLLTILAVGGNRSQVVFEKVFDLLVAAGEAGELRPGVKQRAVEELKKLSSSHAVDFNLKCEAVQAKRTSGGAFGNVSAMFAEPARRGPPASRLKQLQARRERDQKRHAATAGRSGGGGGKGSQSKKKK